ncbi:hypothetical protein [Pseudoalteromonas sp.]|uniref:hypothetical protein n=1 Tax=Pseudoalteromonas sp. TaxID=53249 RepID=UPI0035627D38
MHSITMYSLSVSDPAAKCPTNKAGLLELSNIKGLDLLSLLNEWLNLHNKDYSDIGDDEEKKVLHVSRVEEDGRFLSGWVEYGYYGIPGKIVNVKTKKKTRKSKEDSDINHLYFCFYIPENKKNSIALFHKTNQAALKTIFDLSFNSTNFFKDKSGGLKLRIKPLCKKDVLNDWMEKTQVKKLYLERYKDKSIVGDLADKLPIGSTVTVTINAPRGGFIGKMQDWMGKDSEFTEDVTLLSDMCGDLTTKVDYKGRKSKTVLSNKGTESRVIITSSDVEMHEGFPKFNSIDTYAKQLATELMENQ